MHIFATVKASSEKNRDMDIKNRIRSRKHQSFILNYDKKTALNAAVAMSFILAFVMLSSSLYFISLDKNSGVRFIDIISFRSVITLLINTLVLYFLFRLQFWMITRYPNNKVKVWIVVLASFAVIALVSPVLSRMQWWWFKSEVSVKAYTTLHYVKDLMVLIISFLFTALIYLINQNQKKVTENQDLVIENLQNKYNALKNQVDPHFLFNSLNTLSGLINFENERAQEYLRQLSIVFRYTMQDKLVTTLSDELQFSESYIYLMKIRYNDGLNVHLRIDPAFRKNYILPFGLQVLIENAVKHNVISRKNPLCIIIETTAAGAIRVENNLQPKQGKTESNGLGLANLNERYRLMFGREIEIKATGETFSVEIPLMENQKMKLNPVK